MNEKITTSMAIGSEAFFLHSSNGIPPEVFFDDAIKWLKEKGESFNETEARTTYIVFKTIHRLKSKK